MDEKQLLKSDYIEIPEKIAVSDVFSIDEIIAEYKNP